MVFKEKRSSCIVRITRYASTYMHVRASTNSHPLPSKRVIEVKHIYIYVYLRPRSFKTPTALGTAVILLHTSAKSSSATVRRRTRGDRTTVTTTMALNAFSTALLVGLAVFFMCGFVGASKYTAHDSVNGFDSPPPTPVVVVFYENP